MPDVTVNSEMISFLRSALPGFWEMKTAISRLKNVKELTEFYAVIIKNDGISHSQLFQDIFVDFVMGNERDKKFLEFGATNGIELSNTLMLENVRGWRGVLAEPDPQWHSALFANRPNAQILKECIYSKSNEKLKFISSSIGVLSSLELHALDDANGPLRGNAAARMASYNSLTVTTISLNDVFEKYFSGKPVEYVSVDTEGSELEILKSFNFTKYRPLIMTVEHNFTEAQKSLDSLLYANDYARIFAELTSFDAWYVRKDVARARNLI